MLVMTLLVTRMSLVHFELADLERHQRPEAWMSKTPVCHSHPSSVEGKAGV